MKALAILSTLVAIALAAALAVTYHTYSVEDDELGETIEILQLKLDSAERAAASARSEQQAHRAELDTIRSTLAEAKILENGLRLQIAEQELQIRQLREAVQKAEQTREALQNELRQVRSELVQIHTSGNAQNLSQKRLEQYEKEIAELQQQLRKLQSQP